MQEYVKIKTDKTTTELLKQVSEAIELAITESLNNIEIKGNLETVIQNQKEFPNFIQILKEQLVKISNKAEKVSDNNLSQIISKNETNRNIIIKEIVALFEKISKQDNTLSGIHLLLKEIEKNSKPIAEIRERTILNYDGLSENLKEIIKISNGSSLTLDKVFMELSDIKEQIKINNNEIKDSIKLILSQQNSSIEKINTIETIQNKPWYKKIFK